MSSCYFDPPLEPVRVIQSTTTFRSRKLPTYISSDSKSDSVILEEISDSEPPIYMTSDSESQSHMKEYFSGSQSDIDKAKPANMSQNPSLHKDISKNEYPFIMNGYYLDFGDHCGKHISQMYLRHFDYILWLKNEGVHRQRPELGEAIEKYERENFPVPEDYVFTFGMHEGKRFEQVPERYVKYLRGKGGEKLMSKHPGLRDALEWFQNRLSRSAISNAAEAVISNSKKRETKRRRRAKGRRVAQYVGRE
jgi:hypothetical protein